MLHHGLVTSAGATVTNQQSKNLLVLGVIVLGMGSFARNVVHREFVLPEGECALIQTIRVDSAEDDAKDAIQAKDFHLYAVGEASLTVPGLSDQAAKDRYAVKPIPCAGDTYSSPWHQKLIQDARRYAEHYNTAILHALDEEQAQK